MHHEFWIVTTFNKIFGPAVAAALAPLGYHLDPAHAVPDYLVMTLLIVLGLTALCLLVKSQLSHRARAFERLIPRLLRLLASGAASAPRSASE